ncbi:MAG: Mu transposase C-terminal domain-containing protein, partial [bacterium]
MKKLMKEFLSIQDIADLTGLSERRCEQIAKSCSYDYIPGHGRNGKQLRVYVTSLPLNLQRHFWKRELKDKDYPEYKIRAAWKRFDFLQEVEDRRAEAPRGRKKFAFYDVLLKHDVCERTSKNWSKAFKDHGFVGLMPRWGDNGIMDKRIPKYIKKEIKKLYARGQQPTISAVVEKVNELCQKKNHEPLSRYKVECIINTIPECVKVLTRKGKKEFDQKYGFYIKRDWSTVPVNGVWCGDHRQLDVLVKRGNKQFAPWITCWIDMKSRMITGWYISENPNSDTVAVSFRHGVLRAGLPESIYIDNGKDYRSYYFSGHQRKIGKIDFGAREKFGMMAALGVEIQHALPYNHKAKPIESFFKFMASRFDREQPGWRGPHAKAKPEKLELEIKKGLLLDFETFKNKMAEWIEWYNTQWVHSATKQTPQSFYGDEVQVVEVSKRKLDFLLMKKKEVCVNRRGITLFGIDYFSRDIPGRKKLQGEYVEIRWDPNDMREILVFDQNGFVCRLPAKFAVDA